MSDKQFYIEEEWDQECKDQYFEKVGANAITPLPGEVDSYMENLEREWFGRDIREKET